jgi:hypothetical protein
MGTKHPALLQVTAVLLLFAVTGFCAGRFVDNGNGTVTDTTTGLMWASKDNGADINWEQAKKYCESFEAGGHKDWRLPTNEELKTLYDASGERNATCCLTCDETIKFTKVIDLSCFALWSSETGSSDALGPFAKAGDFRYGGPMAYSRTLSRQLRALPVRSTGK